jgi:hypothetical protein
MNNLNENDIDNLLSKWYETKQEIALLEKKCDKYKKVAEKVMVNTNKNIINNGIYSLQKKNITKNTISKGDLPIDIWNKFSKNTNYSAFYISKIKK